MSPNRILSSALVGVMLILSACSSSGEEISFPITGPNDEIKGVLKIEKGVCDEVGPVSGSWFRMFSEGETVKENEPITNFDSLCPNQTYSLLSPGKVGLRTGQFQEGPNPPFDSATNGLADDIIMPTRFFSVTFALSSEKTNPLTGASLRAPQLKVSTLIDKSGELILQGQLESLFVAWNGDLFEQGSPHPEGYVGQTGMATGKINAKTGRFRLEWFSEVSSGPFKGFLGDWHLEGVFIPD